MPVAPRPIEFSIDFSTDGFDTGSPTYTDRASEIHTVNISGTRDEVEATTGEYLVKKIEPGAWDFGVEVQFRVTAAFRTLWNNAVIAGTACSYRYLEDTNNAASATNMQTEGQFVPLEMMFGKSDHGGIVEKTMTLKPGGSEPYIKITDAAAVYAGKT